MSKKVKIHAHDNPFEVVVNGKKYSYPAGEEVEVPDDVAHVIEEHNKLDAPEAPRNDITFDGTWDTLKNKPFYEETTTVGGDTLTWDGNTEGLLNFANMMFKVSDAVPTAEDFANGFEAAARNADGEETTTSATYANMENQGMLNQQEGFIILGDFGIVVMKDNLDLGNGVVYPEAGVWLMNSNSAYVSRFTIPGYTGFETTTTVVKPLDEKYMPILTSPSGKKFKLSVDDSGVISATEV